MNKALIDFVKANHKGFTRDERAFYLFLLILEEKNLCPKKA